MVSGSNEISMYSTVSARYFSLTDVPTSEICDAHAPTRCASLAINAFCESILAILKLAKFGEIDEISRA